MGRAVPSGGGLTCTEQSPGGLSSAHALRGFLQLIFLKDTSIIVLKIHVPCRSFGKPREVQRLKQEPSAAPDGAAHSSPLIMLNMSSPDLSPSVHVPPTHSMFTLASLAIYILTKLGLHC